MSPSFRLQCLTKYPPWHQQPLRLNCAEISNPFSVIASFFDIYDIVGLRHSLNHLFEDALNGNQAQAKNHLYTTENLQRLAEAAWLIFQQSRNEKENEIVAKQNPADFPMCNAASPPYRSLRLIDLVFVDPLYAVQQVFKKANVHSLKSILQTWQNIAFIGENPAYAKGVERAGVIEFCHQIQVLIEAAYVKAGTAAIEQRTGVDLSRPANLQADLMKMHVQLIKEEDIGTSEKCMQNFFSLFSLLHARCQLWDLFGAAIQHKNEAEPATLDQYEFLSVMIEGAWQLQKVTLNSTNNDNQTG
jgi:hypothetical protein